MLLGRVPVFMWNWPTWPWIVILPESSFLEAWSFLMLVFVIIESCSIPVEYSFQIQTLPEAWNWFTTSFFVADLLLSFTVGYPDRENETVIDGRLIARRYIFSRWFVMDAMSAIPFEAIYEASIDSEDDAVVDRSATGLSFIGMIKLTRLLRLSKLLKRFQKLHTGGGIEFGKLMGIVILLTHWVACGWNLVGDQWRCGDANVYNNLNRDDCVDASVLTKYCECLHQACVSIFASGVATTRSEQVFFSVVMLMGSIMQASVFGAVANVFASLDHDNKEYESKVAHVQAHLKWLGLPSTLQERVLNYFESLWHQHRVSDSKQLRTMIEELPHRLRSDIKLALYAPMIYRVPFLANVNFVIADDLIDRMKERIYLQGDLVMRKGEPGDWMVRHTNHRFAPVTRHHDLPPPPPPPRIAC